MDSIKQNSNVVKPQTYQDKNFQFIQRLSERSKLKKEEELQNKNLEPKVPVFSNYTNGANKNAFKGTNKFRNTTQIYTGPNRSAQLQNQQLQNPMMNAYSVCMDSIKPIKDETFDINTCQFNASTIQPAPQYQKNVVTNQQNVAHNTQQPSPDSEEVSQIKLNYNKSYHKADDDDDLAELDQFVKDNDQDQKDFNEIKQKTENVCQNAEKVTQLDNKSLEELKMVQLEQESIRLQPKFIPESLFNLIDQMDECYDRSPSNQLDNSQQLPIRINDESIVPDGEEIKETEFQFYEDGDILEENTIKQVQAEKNDVKSETSFPAMISPKPPKIEQKETELNFYEDEDVVEQNTFKQIQPEQSLQPGENFPNMISPRPVKMSEQKPQEKQTELNFYEDEEVIECQSNRPSIDNNASTVEVNTSKISKMNETLQFDKSVRGKMTITKQELYRIQKEAYDETCIIDCEKEKDLKENQNMNSGLKIISGIDILSQEKHQKEHQASVLKQVPSVQPSTENSIIELSVEQKAHSKTPRSRKIIRKRKTHTPEQISPQIIHNSQLSSLRESKQIKADSLLTGSLQPLQKQQVQVNSKQQIEVKKSKTKEDRANDLMSSLKRFDINVDDLVKRLHQLPEKQKMIMLGVLKSVERGELEGIDDVKTFVASERSKDIVDHIEAKGQLPKPRRAKRILNTVTLVNSQLSSSGGTHQNPNKIPKDLKHK